MKDTRHTFFILLQNKIWPFHGRADIDHFNTLVQIRTFHVYRTEHQHDAYLFIKDYILPCGVMKTESKITTT